MNRTIADRIAALEARRGQRKPFTVIECPEWSFATSTDRDEWRAEYVHPLAQSHDLIVIIRRLSGPGILHG